MNRNHRPKLLLWMVSMFFTMLAFAQNKTVSGRVADKDGRPLGDVSVKVKGTSVGTTTSAEGTFTIPIEGPESVLSFSFVGYLNYETKVGTLSVFNIQLTASGKDMDDVIVIGYGTQKKSKLTGAVATIKAAEIEDIPAQNIAGALRGRIAGLGVSQASGRPGASISLNVRGAYATGLVGTNDEPLYVIDNMIVDKRTFDNLDPTMVEDITVLKDAQAAIYGASGAKGVILITTKKGKAGAPKLSYSGYAGVADATKKPEMLNAYDHARLLNETKRVNNATPDKLFSDADLEYIRTMPNYNWFDEMWKPAFTQRHSLSVSGGSDNITYFLGGGYQNQNANYAGLKNDRFTLRSGITAKLTKSLSAEVLTNVDNNVRFSHNPWDERDQSFLENLIQVPRWTPITIGGKPVNYANSGNSFTGNPFAMVDSGYYDESKTRSYGINASLSWAPKTGVLKGLTAKFQASQTGANTRNETYTPPFTVYNFVRTGNNLLLYSDSLPIDPATGRPSSASETAIYGGDKSRLAMGQSENSNYRVVFTLQYQKKIGDHDFSIMAGGEQSESRSKSLGYYYQKQQVPDNPFFWAFDQTPIVDRPTAAQSGKRSYFGRFSYNYKGKYTLDGITRADASSNFAANHIWGVFPSFGAGWVISSEKFFDKVPYITYLKVRTNIGLTGEDRVNDRLWQERYNVNVGSYLYNNTYVTGLKPSIIANPDITWEKKRTVNVGVDLSLFNNKLSLTFDAFQNYGYDIFDKGGDDMYPMYAGFAAPVVNNIVRYNWGTEYSISYHANLAKDLQLRAGMNFSFGNSVITQMFYNKFEIWDQGTLEDLSYTLGTDPRIYNSSNIGLKAAGIFRSQEEVDAFLSKNPGYLINGKVPEPGWLYYKDLDGDGQITADDKTTMFKRIDPVLSTGIQLGLSYKNWEWRANIAARIGGKVFYDSKARKSIPTDIKNVPAWWTAGWTPENPNSRLPRIDDPFIGTESDFWAVNGTMIRVNDMTISYAAPKNLVRYIGLNSVRFVLTGNNLFVLKNPLKYKDPYSSSIYDYPILRTVSAGLNLGF